MNEFDIDIHAKHAAHEICTAVIDIMGTVLTNADGKNSVMNNSNTAIIWTAIEKRMQKTFEAVIHDIVDDKNQMKSDVEYMTEAEEKLKELGFTKQYKTQFDVNYWNKTTYPLGEDGQAMITHVYLDEKGRNHVRINLGNVCLTQLSKDSMSISMPIQVDIDKLLKDAQGIAKQKLDEVMKNGITNFFILEKMKDEII